jgi:DNA-binding NarL/FixJ family response regulator
MAIKVVIFDDNAERRESLKYLMGMFPDFSFAGAFEDCTDVISKVEASRPDVVLMDIQMPNVNGIEGVRMIRTVHPEIIIIMQTVFEDDDSVFESIKAGASGYILKKASPDKIAEAIRDAVAGGSPMTPSIANKVLRFFQQNSVPNDYDLTARESEMLGHLVDGLSYKMIADKCGISFHTVNSHLRKIYEKLHVHSLGEAVSKALKEKLV